MQLNIDYVDTSEAYGTNGDYIFFIEPDVTQSGLFVKWAAVDLLGRVIARHEGGGWPVVLDEGAVRIWAAAYDGDEQVGVTSIVPDRTLRAEFQTECLPASADAADATCPAATFRVGKDATSVRIIACTNDALDSDGFIDVRDAAGNLVGELAETDRVDCKDGKRPWDGNFVGAADGDWTVSWQPSLAVDGTLEGKAYVAIDAVPSSTEPSFDESA